MEFTLIRVLRTPHSERFMLLVKEKQFAALELHYLASAKVDGTLILFEDAGVPEEKAGEILLRIDELLFPDISTRDQNISFTVVSGKVLGAFLPDKQEVAREV